MRALEPEVQETVEVDGVRIGYEVFGAGRRTIALAPAWAIVNSRFWKGQVPYLARRFRVVTWDAPGSGRSDRTQDPADHSRGVRNAVAVLDATQTERALMVGLSLGATTALFTAALHPERVAGVVAIDSTVPLLVPGHPWMTTPFDEDPGTDEGWERWTRASWQRDFPGFVEHFVREMFPEPHSEKQIEDCIGWGLDCGRAVLEATMDSSPGYETREQVEAFVSRVRCPVLAIHGDDDRISPLACGRRVAELTGGELVVFEGSGHAPVGRDPIRVNVLLDAFAERILGAAPRPELRWTRANLRGKRALLVSSPIGLGHARRDLAIASELRALVPGLEIDWLAQHPLTTALEAAGERVHPASTLLASESAHLEGLSGDHTLPIFQAIREMDEILINNYMVFRDVVRETPYDLWIGDEAWDVDHFLHENPEDKRAPFAFLTDFVGWLPLPEGGEREAFLCADLNALMIEQVERFPVRARPRAVRRRAGGRRAGRFGPGLPELRDWVPRHFEFVGQMTTAPEPFERNGGGPLCVAAVGGSGVGEGLLARLVAGYEAAAERCPGCGCSRSPGRAWTRRQLRAPDGVEVRAYVPDLDRVLASADVALVQGGLTTGMELIAGGTPFVSFPLKRHFEQRIHVAHRLARHGHTRALEVEDATPEGVAAAVAARWPSRPTTARSSPGGATRAAERIAELL